LLLAPCSPNIGMGVTFQFDAALGDGHGSTNTASNVTTTTAIRAILLFIFHLAPDDRKPLQPIAPITSAT